MQPVKSPFLCCRVRVIAVDCRCHPASTSPSSLFACLQNHNISYAAGVLQRTSFVTCASIESEVRTCWLQICGLYLLTSHLRITTRIIKQVAYVSQKTLVDAVNSIVTVRLREGNAVGVVWKLQNLQLALCLWRLAVAISDCFP